MYVTISLLLSTHCTNTIQDRPWNDAAPRHLTQNEDDTRPTLKAIILDFATVNHLDATVAQTLIDVRNQLDRYAAPGRVDWHFSHIESRWTKRALAAAGFGYRTPQKGSPKGEDGPGHWKTIFSIADHFGVKGADDAAGRDGNDSSSAAGKSDDIERFGVDKDVPRNPRSERLVAVQGLNRPFFHFDLQEALDAAITNAEINRSASEKGGQ